MWLAGLIAGLQRYGMSNKTTRNDSKESVRPVVRGPARMWLPFERPNAVVHMPVVTIGHCKNVRSCKQWNVDLANGLCVRCWDYSNK